MQDYKKYSDVENPCLVCEKTDGKCIRVFYPAIFNHSLATEDILKIHCDTAYEFLKNYADQDKVKELIEKYYDENQGTSNFMIKIYNELKENV